jgi:hypothetical protein
VVTRGRAREFRFPQVSYVDYKQIEIDRTLLNLFPRLKFGGYLGRIKKMPFQLTIEEFQAELTDEKHKTLFKGFADHPEVVRKWLETDLLDLVHRGRPKQAVVSPRPLHGNIYKFRNADHARDYNTSEQVYWMLHYAYRGKDTLDELKKFLFPDMDWTLDRVQQTATTKIDVETQVILHFDAQVKDDYADQTRALEKYPALCMRQANLFAEDILRLLAYENYIPRSVLVDYLKTLFAFHLALYHLRIFKLLPELVKRQRSGLSCQVKGCPLAHAKAVQLMECPHGTGLVVEMGDASNTHMIELARRSADTQYRRIPSFIQAQYVVKNLDDMVKYMTKIGKLSTPARGYFSVAELLPFLYDDRCKQDCQTFFGANLRELIKKNESESQDGTLSPEVKRITDLGLDAFETCIEIIMVNRVQFHRRYITECIDSLLLKNRDGGLLRQARTRDGQRHFALGSRLLEVLLQIAVLTPQGTAFATREMRIDDLLAFLRDRYGLYIDTLPPGDGFGKPSITDLQALQRNKEAFKMRLREIGFFQDLSDAYVTQTVTPRYTITPHTASSKRTPGGKQ